VWAVGWMNYIKRKKDKQEVANDSWQIK
jgi:hypothetical protein